MVEGIILGIRIDSASVLPISIRLGGLVWFLSRGVEVDRMVGVASLFIRYYFLEQHWNYSS